MVVLCACRYVCCTCVVRVVRVLYVRAIGVGALLVRVKLWRIMLRMYMIFLCCFFVFSFFLFSYCLFSVVYYNYPTTAKGGAQTGSRLYKGRVDTGRYRSVKKGCLEVFIFVFRLCGVYMLSLWCVVV